jgi:osmotically-inducible protein OsmY
MKTSRFWSYFAKVGLGAGVTVALAGAPVVAHAEDNTPSGAIQRGGEATGSAMENAGNAADQAGSTASGAAQSAGDEATGAVNKASDTAQTAADKAQGAADQAQGAADRAKSAAGHAGTATDDSSITDAVKTKLKSGDMGDIKVDTDNGVVTLSGTVHQKSTRDHAVQMAKNAKGVKKVKDDIDVVPAK